MIQKTFLFMGVVALALGALFLWQRASSDRLPILTMEKTQTETIVTEDDREIMSTNGIRHSVSLDDEEFRVGIGGGPAKEAILSGKLPRDVISSIDKPKFVSAADAARWLDEEEPGIAFSRGAVHRFYPYQILVRHEIVNDIVPFDDAQGKEEHRVLVTYCPLCLAGIVYDPLVQGERVEFGVSGLLWKANLVMYDRKSNTLWSQVLGEAIVGEATGDTLAILPSDQLRFGNWRKAHPQGEVLSRDTGKPFANYGSNPYGGSYYDLPQTSLAFTDPTDTRLPFGAFVFGVLVKGKAKAYHGDAVRAKGEVVDEFQDTTFKLVYDPDLDVVRMFEVLPDGREERVMPISGFWFSWSEAHPETELYK